MTDEEVNQIRLTAEERASEARDLALAYERYREAHAIAAWLNTIAVFFEGKPVTDDAQKYLAGWEVALGGNARSDDPRELDVVIDDGAEFRRRWEAIPSLAARRFWELAVVGRFPVLPSLNHPGPANPNARIEP